MSSFQKNLILSGYVKAEFNQKTLTGLRVSLSGFFKSSDQTSDQQSIMKHQRPFAGIIKSVGKNFGIQGLLMKYIVIEFHNM